MDHEKDDLGEFEESDEVGIPRKLLIKRRYTMTDAAKDQRREAASQPRPGAEGNKNAWKHGSYAQGYITSRIKPCKSTCPHYPCSLVQEGATKPGGVCLDKAEIVTTFAAVMEALKNKQTDDFQEIAAMRIAEAFQVLSNLLEDIIRDGTIVKSEKWGKDGRLLGHEIVPHPSLMAMTKLLGELKVTPSEFLITPAAIKKTDDEDQGVKTLAELLGRIGKPRKEDAHAGSGDEC